MTDNHDTPINTKNTGMGGLGFAAGLTIVTTIALLLRLYRLDFESFWYDELTQAITYHLPLRYLVPAAAGHGQPPLDYMIGAGLDRLGLATSDWWVRLPAALFGTASVALIGILVKRMTGPVTAITAAGLLAVCPLHVVMSQEARPYTIFIFFVLVTLIAFDFARRRHTPVAWMLFGISATAMILTRWVGPQVVIVGTSAYALGVWFLDRRSTDHHTRAQASQKLWAYGSAIAFAYAIFGPIFGFILEESGRVINTPHGAWFTRVVEQLGDSYQAIWGGYSTSMVYGPLPTPIWLLALAGLLAVTGIVHTAVLARKKPIAAAVLTILLPFPFLYAAIYAKLTSIHAKPQYLLLASVLLTVLVAAGLERIRLSLTIRRRIIGSFVYAALLASLVLPMGSVSWSLLNRRDKRDWRGLQTFLKNHANENDAFAVVSSDAVPAIYHPFAGGKYRYGIGRNIKFQPIDLTTTPDELKPDIWERSGNTVWIVGINDGLYTGTTQLPPPTGYPNDVIVKAFYGVFVVGVPGATQATERLARGLSIITENLPDQSAAVAPWLFYGRLLLANGKTTAAKKAFAFALRQCQSEDETEKLLHGYLPGPRASEN